MTMRFRRLVPSFFYQDLLKGLELFEDCLGFTLEHQDLTASQPYCVLSKGDLTLMIFQDVVQAKSFHPELRMVTDDIDEVYSKVVSSHPHLLHPNLDKVTLRHWGALEFALMDEQMGIRIQQW